MFLCIHVVHCSTTLGYREKAELLHFTSSLRTSYQYPLANELTGVTNTELINPLTWDVRHLHLTREEMHALTELKVFHV